MSFFGKLKSKLFKSSSKLDEGLDAIVSEGGEETTTPDLPLVQDTPPRTQPDTPEQPAHAVDDPGEPVSDPDPAPPVAPPPDASRTDTPPPISDIPTEDAADMPVDDGPSGSPEPDAPLDPVSDDSAAPDLSPAPEDRGLAPSEPEPEPTPSEAPFRTDVIAPRLDAAVQEAPEADKPGLLGRILGRSAAPSEMRRELDDDMLEQLEELLIQADMGVDTALRVTANIAEGRYGKKLSVREIKELLAGEVARIMEPVARPLPLYPTKPQVVLVVGVNGSGKTTTIGKLASQFRAAGKHVVIAAGDTFRAAAVEQLQVWGDRAGVPVLTAPEGSDPASLAFDAMTQAQADGADLLMIDTAGRLQNRADLMEELAKIVRVIRKKDPDAPHNTLLVLDATTGQNAVSQVKTFQELADVTGLVMTKLDGTAKGGVLVSLADRFGLPIHAIGVGEQIDDLQAFDPEEFAAALTGLTTE
ncbi:signal recognition particle-docking protein FtsY [Marivita sp. S0852]|uniref:signal recognition particle-docking protein FtsY n=1 Tax=Marivita sp. S0852 TaxID=3373893 RepID=UPI003982B87D